MRASWRYFLEIYWKLKYIQGYLGGGFKDFFLALKLGKGSQLWRAYFSDGLVQPPTSCVEMLVGKKEVVGWVKIYNGIKRKHVVIYFFLTFRLYTIKKYPYYTEELFLLNMYSFFPIPALFVEDFFIAHSGDCFCLFAFFLSFERKFEFWVDPLGNFFLTHQEPPVTNLVLESPRLLEFFGPDDDIEGIFLGPQKIEAFFKDILATYRCHHSPHVRRKSPQFCNSFVQVLNRCQRWDRACVI